MVKKQAEKSKTGLVKQIEAKTVGKAKGKVSAKNTAMKRRTLFKSVEFWLVRHGQTTMNLKDEISHQVKG